tara:strand:+ start:101 stop:628 length:528 start_codon:yes stop_codon:yes gene_type:complete
MMLLKNLKKSIPKKNTDKFLKYCNTYSLFINMIVGIVCISIILVYRHYYNDLIKTEGKVIHSQCSHKHNYLRSKHKTSFQCDITVEYQYNNEILRNNLITTSGDEYIQNDTITILHDGNSNLKEFNILYYGAYILSYIVIVYLCINTYFRIYHKNNKFVKAWITFTCVDNIIGYF